MLWPGYKAEKVCNEPSVWVSAPEPMREAMTDETPLESSPPDSDTPTGTSAIMCRRMTRSNSSPKPPAYSASGRDDENSGLTSGAQYLLTAVRPSTETVMKCPGSSRFTPWKKVSSPASCTRWSRNWYRTPMSGAREMRGSWKRAFSSEAKQNRPGAAW